MSEHFPQPHMVDGIIRAIPSQQELEAQYGAQPSGEEGVITPTEAETAPKTYALRRSSGELEDGYSIVTSYGQNNGDEYIVTGYELRKETVDASGAPVEILKNVSIFEFAKAQQDKVALETQNSEHTRANRITANHTLGRAALH